VAGVNIPVVRLCCEIRNDSALDKTSGSLLHATTRRLSPHSSVSFLDVVRQANPDWVLLRELQVTKEMTRCRMRGALEARSE